MASVEQWAEQEEIFLKQIKGELTFNQSWKLHKEVIAKYFGKEESDTDFEDGEEAAFEVKVEVDQDTDEAKEAHPRSLQSKSRQNVDNRSFPCEFCEYSAKMEHTLMVHIQMNHMQLSYQCKLCDFNLTRVKEKYVTKKHILEVHGTKVEDLGKYLFTKCGFCETWANEDGTKKHFNAEHPEYAQYLFSGFQTRSGIVKDLTCSYCPEDFTKSGGARSQLLKQHIQNVHIKAIFKCDKCNFEANIKQNLLYHIQEIHMPENLDRREQREWARLHILLKCHICHFQLPSSEKGGMEKHMQTDHKEFLLKVKQYPCNLCTLVFGSGIKLRHHRKKLHPDDCPERGYKCNLCDFGSNLEGNLKLHMHKHLGTKFICNICGYISTGRPQLKSHFVVYHKEQMRENYMANHCQYQCGQCGTKKAYNDYNEHMITIHKFEISQTRFSRSGPRRADSEHMHQCKQCNYGTNMGSQMRFHMHKHIKSSFTCNLCDLKSTNRGPLTKHIIEEHSEVTNENEWMEEQISCHCKECGTTMKSKAFDFHLIEIHDFPKRINISANCPNIETDDKTIEETEAEVEDTEVENAQKCKEDLEANQLVIVPNQRMRGRYRQKSMDSNNEYQCKECGYGTNSGSLMRFHIHKHIRSSYSCNICGTRLGARGALMKHIMQEHKTDEEGLENQISCHCAKCGISEKSSAFDKHLVKEHNFPPRLRKHAKRTRKGLDISNGKRSTGKLRPIPTGRSESPIKCPSCLFVTNYGVNLRQHMHQKHTKTQYTCKICDFASTRLSKVDSHIASQHNMEGTSKEVVEGYISCHCKACGIETTPADFNNHLILVHKFSFRRNYSSYKVMNKRESVIRKSIIPGKDFDCKKCGENFSSFTEIEQHISKVHLKIEYFCNICDLKASDKEEFKEHVESEHSGISSSSTYCPECDASIDNNSSAEKSHVKSVHGDLIVNSIESNFSKHFLILGKCKFCQSDADPNSIEQHILKNHMKIKYQCSQCSFSTKNLYIRIHLRVSHKDFENKLLQMRCGLCSKVIDLNQTIEHIESHENELLETIYAYNKCEPCNYQTISKRKFNSHQSYIHGLQLHTCKECNLNFKSNQGLVTHVKDEHPDFRYKCKHSDCPFDFKSKHYAALLRHMAEMHEGTALYKCHFCENKFRRNEYLAKHIEEEHNEDGTTKARTSQKHPSIPRRRFGLKKRAGGPKQQKKQRQRRRMMKRSK